MYLLLYFLQLVCSLEKIKNLKNLECLGTAGYTFTAPAGRIEAVQTRSRCTAGYTRPVLKTMKKYFLHSG